MLSFSKPTLYIHVGQATHFLKWEIAEFARYFTIVDKPSIYTVLLAFGPDILYEASRLPALERFAVLFPGFGHNPLYDKHTRSKHRSLIANYYKGAFINNGPLQIAYKDLNNIYIYSFSVDTKLLPLKKYRKEMNSLVHISSDYPQKDWQRSKNIMHLTGLKFDVYPPRDHEVLHRINKKQKRINKLKKLTGIPTQPLAPSGYMTHKAIIKKYYEYDGFVHVAKDIKSPTYIDGKYTATLIEAGITGCILFWHDTFGLGNNLDTVFDLPLNERRAAQTILDIRQSIDVNKHSKLTRDEMLDTFNVSRSVRERATVILDCINKI